MNKADFYLIFLKTLQSINFKAFLFNNFKASIKLYEKKIKVLNEIDEMEMKIFHGGYQ